MYNACICLYVCAGFRCDSNRGIVVGCEIQRASIRSGATVQRNPATHRWRVFNGTFTYRICGRMLQSLGESGCLAWLLYDLPAPVHELLLTLMRPRAEMRAWCPTRVWNSCYWHYYLPSNWSSDRVSNHGKVLQRLHGASRSQHDHQVDQCDTRRLLLLHKWHCAYRVSVLDCATHQHCGFHQLQLLGRLSLPLLRVAAGQNDACSCHRAHTTGA